MAKAKKLPSGNWRVLLYVGTGPDGKRQYKSFTAETKQEAEYKAANYKMRKPARHEKITLREAYEGYIESKSAVLSPSTVLDYKKHARNDFPELMDMPLEKLDALSIQAAVNKAAARLSPKSVLNMHGLLTAVLGLYMPDMTLHTRLPQRKRQQIRIPEEREIEKIAEAIRGDRMELPFLLASQLGMRASEIAGLRYECVNADESEITINKALVRGDAGGASGVVLKEPKSEAGNRTLPCPKYIIDLMEPEKHSASEYVTGMTSGAITSGWSRFMKKQEIDFFNFHALRHYFASKALLMGIPKKYVAELMGHSSEHMLDEVYEHTFKDAKNKYAEILKEESERFHG